MKRNNREIDDENSRLKKRKENLTLQVNKCPLDGNHDMSRKEIGGFSMNAKGHFVNDKSSLTYLHENKEFKSLDLKLGYDTYIDKKEQFPGNLEAILKWFTEEGRKKPDSSKVDFICWRGLLKKLLTSPYETQDDWAFVVKKFKGTCYMVELLTTQKRIQNTKMTPFHHQASYWGFKFEQYMTTEARGGTPDDQAPVNNHQCYASLSLNQLAQHSIMLAGEVDCMSETEEYVELKTSKYNCKPYTLKRFKYFNWWAQCYLLGVEKMVVGLRDDDGVVRELQHLKVEQLPREAINWRPDVCLDFLDRLLKFVRDVVDDGGDNSTETYLFERKVNDEVRWSLIDEKDMQGEEWRDGKVGGGVKGETGGKREGDEGKPMSNKELIKSVLPAWYTHLMEDQSPGDN